MFFTTFKTFILVYIQNRELEKSHDLRGYWLTIVLLYFMKRTIPFVLVCQLLLRPTISHAFYHLPPPPHIHGSSSSNWLYLSVDWVPKVLPSHSTIACWALPSGTLFEIFFPKCYVYSWFYTLPQLTGRCFLSCFSFGTGSKDWSFPTAGTQAFLHNLKRVSIYGWSILKVLEYAPPDGSAH